MSGERKLTNFETASSGSVESMSVCHPSDYPLKPFPPAMMASITPEDFTDHFQTSNRCIEKAPLGFVFHFGEKVGDACSAGFGENRCAFATECPFAIENRWIDVLQTQSEINTKHLDLWITNTGAQLFPEISDDKNASSAVEFARNIILQHCASPEELMSPNGFPLTDRETVLEALQTYASVKILQSIENFADICKGMEADHKTVAPYIVQILQHMLQELTAS